MSEIKVGTTVRVLAAVVVGCVLTAVAPQSAAAQKQSSIRASVTVVASTAPEALAAADRQIALIDRAVAGEEVLLQGAVSTETGVAHVRTELVAREAASSNSTTSAQVTPGNKAPISYRITIAYTAN